jgi:hypothetical protein
MRRGVEFNVMRRGVEVVADLDLAPGSAWDARLPIGVRFVAMIHRPACRKTDGIDGVGRQDR